MRLRTLVQASIEKRSRQNDPNEDVVRPNPIPAFTNRVAISDGASESYDSRTLAEIICENWINSKRIPGICLNKIEVEFNKRTDLETLGWSRAAAHDRGSFATFLGVDLLNSELRVLAIGDSFLVLWYPETRWEILPYSEFSEVPISPTLISSKRSLNKFCNFRFYRKIASSRRSVPVGTSLLLMTDALGLWLLNHPDRQQGINEILALRRDDFRKFVDDQRSNKMLKDDDTTLVHLEVVADE